MIRKIRFWRYHLPLKKGLYLSSDTLTVREGIVIEIETSSGMVGYGDVYPLPGFHPESLEDVLVQLPALMNELVGQIIDDEWYRLEGAFEELLGKKRHHSSLRCGVEMALLDLVAQRDNKTLRNLILPSASDQLCVQGLLLQNASEEDIRQVEGYSAVKIKVGRDPENDALMVQAIHKRLGPNCRLRLDANRAWSLDEALIFSDGISLTPIDYIEEPLKDSEKMAMFCKKSPLKVALDESLPNRLVSSKSSWQPTFHSIPKGVGTLVLKPSMLGGVERTARLIRLAKKSGFRPIISAAFPSPLGLHHIAQFTAALLPDEIAGLAIGDLYQEELAPTFSSQCGMVDLRASDKASKQINKKLLTLIPL